LGVELFTQTLQVNEDGKVIVLAFSG
jgi:hypothetical protein